MQPVDRHTLHELQILSENSRSGSILKFFDRTETLGGADYLKSMITKPPKTFQEVNRFQALLKVMVADPAAWKVDIARAYAAAAESYHALGVAHSMSQDAVVHWFDTWWYSFKNPAEFYRIQSGVIATLRLLKAIRRTLQHLPETDIPEEIADGIVRLRKFVGSPMLIAILKRKDDKISNRSVFYLDYHFRVSHKTAFRHVLDTFYRLDACLAIAKTALRYQMALPVFETNTQRFHTIEAWHPLIKDAVGNDLVLTGAVGIITGANTSGKTTFLKTCGVLVYLAHLGWPVPAKSLHLPFIDHLFTSIHLSDDLDQGFSHFYNEMMRIRQIAEALSHGEKCFVIVDELFRGTNQEDAFHCSKTVLDGFSSVTHSHFLVSTHLHELITHYSENANLSFRCFRTRISDNQFQNTFKIEEGAAFEKVGRLIMEQTGVTELLQNAKRPSSE